MKRKGDAAAVSFHMVLRSRVNKKLKSIATLPEEIIFNILLLLPADVLYDVMRYLCRQWLRIINDPGFIATHLIRSPSILLFQFHGFNCQYLHVGESDIELTDINFQFPGLVIASCNGLTIIQDKRYETTHRLCYIANPATNRMMTLPTFPLNKHRCTLAFAASSNSYKVLVATLDWKDDYFTRYDCAILTVGVDREWRLINCADMDTKFKKIFMAPSVVSGGFIYWPSTHFSCVLSFNIESEIVKAISIPQICRHCGHTYFLPKDNSVSFIHICNDFSIEIWVLRDRETEDWVRLPVLGTEGIKQIVTNFPPHPMCHIKHTFLFIRPLSWLKNEERILFQTMVLSTYYFVYDIKTGSIFTFTKGVRPPGWVFHNVSSLTWI